MKRQGLILAFVLACLVLLVGRRESYNPPATSSWSCKKGDQPVGAVDIWWGDTKEDGAWACNAWVPGCENQCSASSKPLSKTTDVASLQQVDYKGKKDFVLTWYSHQDNTPSNSMSSSSGRTLIPFVSVAVPFRLLKKFGGNFDYGTKLYVAFLKDRPMPNGTKHTGWVQIDDFCGDGGNDSYCFKKGKPSLDLYIGDITKSGYDTTSSKCPGPAGNGQQKTLVYTGTPGEGQWIEDYGGAARSSNKCGDAAAGKRDHGKCYYYAASNSKEELSWCV